MAWKLDDLFKAVGNGLEGLTATAARLMIDLGRAMIPPMPRFCCRGRRMFAGDGYTALGLRVLLLGVLMLAVLLFYGHREGLANLVYFGLRNPQIDAAADGHLWRSGAIKPGATVPGGEANPGGEITQALASQNLTQFITSAAVVALALLILFEIAFMLGRRLVARADAGFEREVYLCSAAGFITFGLYLWLLWGPFLDSTGGTTESPGFIGGIFYGAWDAYVALWGGSEPGASRRIEVIERDRARWAILLAFFAIPATVCFLRLIRVLRFRLLVGLWHRLRPGMALAMTRPGVRIVRRALLVPLSLAMSLVTVVGSLFVGCVLLILLADMFDPSRNLTIEGVNLFPDPQQGQNLQLLTFVVRNGTDHPFVLGLLGPRVTVRVPAREPCRDHAEYHAFFAPPDGPQPSQLPATFAQQVANRAWLPPCGNLRGVGVEIPFELVAVRPLGSAVSTGAADERLPRDAHVVPPGAGVIVTARERGAADSDTVMRCAFERLVPTAEVTGGGPPVNELQVRVVLAGGRQIVSSDFRRYPGVLLQPSPVAGAALATRPCGAEPFAPPPVEATAHGRTTEPAAAGAR